MIASGVYISGGFIVLVLVILLIIWIARRV